MIDGRVAAAWAAVHYGGARSVSEVAALLGCAGSTAWLRLHDARNVGLVDFEDRRDGTLRSAVGRVA